MNQFAANLNFFHSVFLLEQFFNMISSKRNQCILLHHPLISQQQFSQYSLQIQILYNSIFNDSKDILYLNKLLPFQLKKSSTYSCSNTIQKSDEYFQCFDCQMGIMICSDCFSNSDHTGHRFTRKKQKIGYCVCGQMSGTVKATNCSNHSKSPKLIERDEANDQKFKNYICNIFKWYFLLQQNNHEKSQILGYVLADYLNEMNKQSLYYNQLTSQIIIGKSTSPSILTNLFLIKNNRSTNQFCKLIFKLFKNIHPKNQQIFIHQYINAYNCNQQFLSSTFGKQLFILLFFNTQILQIMVNNQKLILLPKYEPDEKLYFNHLTNLAKSRFGLPFFKEMYKICSIKSKTVKKLQSQLRGRTSDHIIRQFTQFIGVEVQYIKLMTNIFYLMVGYPQNMKSIILSLYYEVKKQQYINNENKVILPHYRALAIGIFSYFNSDLQQINVNELLNLLQIKQQQLIEFLAKKSIDVIGCLWQFSKTVQNKHTYFIMYTPWYLQEGERTIGKDFLFLRITSVILGQLNKEYLFSESLIQFIQGQSKKQLTNLSIIFSFLMSLLIQCVISYRQQISLSFANNNMQLSNAKQLFNQFVNLESQLSWDQVDTFFQIVFGFQVNQKIINGLIRFDKSSKKIVPLVSTNKKINFTYYQSLTKFAFFQKFNDGLPNPIQLSKLSSIIIKTLIPPTLFQFYIKKQQNNNDNSTERYIKQLLKIHYLYQSSNFIIRNQLDVIIKTLPNQLKQLPIIKVIKKQIKYLEMENQQQSIQNQQQNKKFIFEHIKNKKIQQFMKKRDIAKKKHLIPTIQSKHEQSQKLCMICREYNQYKVLCVLGRLYISNTVNQILQIPGYIISMMGCTHHMHLQCCLTVIQDKTYFNCPLCKMACNILIPLPEQYTKSNKSQDIIKTIFDRISVIKSLYASTNKKVNLQKEAYQQTFIQILQSFIQLLYFRPLQNLNRFAERQYPFIKCLFSLAKQYYLSITQKSQYGQIQIKIENLLSKIQANTFHKLIISNLLKLLFKNIISDFIQEENLIFQNIPYIQPEVVSIISYTYSKIVKQNNQLEKPILNQNRQLYWVNKIKNKTYIPKNIKQMFQIRDKVEQNCKSIHHTLICCLCGKKICEECKTMVKHIVNNHFGKCIFMSLQDGITRLCFKTYIYTNEPIYVNQLGRKWSPQLPIDNFELNEEEYNRILNMDVQNTLQLFIAKLIPIQKYQAHLRQQQITFVNQ